MGMLQYEDFEVMFGGWSAFHSEGGVCLRDPHAPLVIRKIYLGKKPAGCVSRLTDSSIKRLKELGLEVKTCSETGSSTSVTVIARRGIAKEVLRRKDVQFFSSFNFKDRLAILVKQIKGMSILDAVVYLLNSPGYIEDPAIEVCVGLLFGYPVCCIQYFIETSHFGIPRDPKEELENRYSELFHVEYALCKRCREKRLFAIWKIAKQLNELEIQ